MNIGAQPRPCANPGCPNLVPAGKPGHRAKLTCSDRCRKAASRTRQQEAARHQEEATRRTRLERWQVFRPSTRRSLERLEKLAGVRLAEELAEAIRSERARRCLFHRPFGDTLPEEPDHAMRCEST
jgi:hypothetical protein